MLKVYQDRNFCLLIAGKFLTLFSSALFDIALLWYFLDRYGPNAGGPIALVTVLSTAPAAAMSGPLGWMVDRFGRKSMLLTAQLTTSASLWLVATRLGGDSGLFGALIVLAMGKACIGIAVNSLIPELFSREQYGTINSVNQFADRSSLLLGFLMGGGVITLCGVEKVFIIAGGLSSLAAFCTYAIRVILTSTAFSQEEHWQNNTGVMTFIRKNRPLLSITLLVSFLNFLWDPLLAVLIPYLLKTVFYVSPTQFGLIQAALPTGFCLGAAWFSSKECWLQRRNVLLSSMLGVNILLSLLCASFWLRPSAVADWKLVVFLCIVLGLTGIFSAALNIRFSVMVQMLVPQRMLGKYWGVSRTLTAGLVPMGALFLGGMIGTATPGWLLNGVIIMAYLLIGLGWRSGVENTLSQTVALGETNFSGDGTGGA